MIPRTIQSTVPPRRAFALVEMMIVVGLLMLFITISAMITTYTFRVSQRAADGHAEIVRMESAVRALQADVWDAPALQVPDAQSLDIPASPGRPQVQWTVRNGALQRAEGNQQNQAPRQWPLGAVHVQFYPDDAGLRLQLGTDTQDHVELRLMSQRILLEGGR
jgi:competence protein ComGC